MNSKHKKNLYKTQQFQIAQTTDVSFLILFPQTDPYYEKNQRNLTTNSKVFFEMANSYDLTWFCKRFV